jgi:hypothetical protein
MSISLCSHIPKVLKLPLNFLALFLPILLLKQIPILLILIDIHIKRSLQFQIEYWKIDLPKLCNENIGQRQLI